LKKATPAKVSIVMPVYNKVDYIDMMLESVYCQIWDNIELILVNDGATDGTRKKLSEWEPRFQKRGYEIVIIDQENQGIPGAVRTGLQIITGEYVCLVDCDDKLDLKYVSTMVGWLEEHPEDSWAACLFSRFTIMDGKPQRLSTIEMSYIPSPPNMIEKYLSAKYLPAIWIYMVRTEYLKKCKVVEGFITDIRSTQEPGYILPLMNGGGRIKVIDIPLYNHNLSQARTSAHKSTEYAIDFQNKYMDMTLEIIKNLDADIDIKEKWTVMARLAHKSFLLPTLLKNYDIENDEHLKIISEAVSLLSTHFSPDPGITVKQILQNGYGLLAIAVADCILGVKPPEIPEIKGRVIGCGALGEISRKHIPELVGTRLEPKVLWDKSASCGDNIKGIPVTLPEYGTLTNDDIVLIFPHDSITKTEIFNAVNASNATNFVFDSFIGNSISAHIYPQFSRAAFIV
jgi:glycosyltransferase involved in cell wall biosynthesis